MRVAVSPKSFTKLMGPAPWGRSLIVSSLSLMSSNCLPTSATPFWSRIATTFTLVRVLDVMRSILEFSAIFSSMRRVTSCSIFSALAPGQEQTAIASRTGRAGSWRCGLGRRRKAPQAHVARAGDRALVGALGHEHGVAPARAGGLDDGAQGHRGLAGGNLGPRGGRHLDRRHHPRLELPARIGDGDLDAEDPALGVGRGGHRGDAPGELDVREGLG